jgi:hypothetical protein
MPKKRIITTTVGLGLLALTTGALRKGWRPVATDRALIPSTRGGRCKSPVFMRVKSVRSENGACGVFPRWESTTPARV